MTHLGDILAQAAQDATPYLDNPYPDPVLQVMGKRRLSENDLALLLSPGADALLEPLATQSARITRARFGNAVSLYAPLYVSNRCSGTCPYCGFKRTEKIHRTSLTMDQVETEGRALQKTGIQHVLLVSGDDHTSDVSFLQEAVKRLKPLFPSVTVEIPPLDEAAYAHLLLAGVDGVTLYQETYDQERYRDLHTTGQKADYRYRLEALDRAGSAGIRKLNIGALWGLAPWRKEAFCLGLHARYLEKTHWRSHILIGMPRLHNVPADFTISHPVCDTAFCHIITAMRLFLHDAGIVVSTRESPAFRDNLLALGATQFSAGSRTEPGGYTHRTTPPGKQFQVDDTRSPEAVRADLRARGFDPVFKDWDTGFTE